MLFTYKLSTTAFVVGLVIAISFAGSGIERATAATNLQSISIKSQQGCLLTGRKWKNNACQRECQSQSATFIKRASTGYCRGYVTVSTSEQVCVNQLHRMFISELKGCARKPGKTDGFDTRYCQSSYPYYNANYRNKAKQKQTSFDVCEKSKAFANRNETTGTPGSAVSLSSNPTPESKFLPEQVLIIGDSITQGSREGKSQGHRGWWSFFLDNRKGTFKFSSEGGSGFMVKKKEPGKTTFLERINDISTMKPKAIVVAGGYNDRTQQNTSGGIRHYFDELDTALYDNGINKNNVFVMVPRPAGAAENIVTIVRENAQRIGVRYIDIAPYSTTFDGVHPDTIGAKRIFNMMSNNSDFDNRLVSR